STPTAFLRGNASGTGWTIGSIGAADLPPVYVDLVSSQTIAGAKTFTSAINGDITGNAANATNAQNANFATTANTANSAMMANSAITFQAPLAGDVQGAQTATQVVAINGSPLGFLGMAQNGQLLGYNGTQWVPKSLSGFGGNG